MSAGVDGGAAETGRASVLTPPGRGAIAVVSAGGPAALTAVDLAFRAANGKPIREQRIDRIIFGHWRQPPEADASAAPFEQASPAQESEAAAEPLSEEVVVCRRADDAVEVHCHGGVAAVERVLSIFAAAGCTVEPWQRRVARSSGGRLEADATIALAAAPTLRTAAILLEQRQGALRRELRACEACLIAGDCASAAQGLSILGRRVALGRRLVQPWRVVIGGRANVGKSTLLNALLGYERAIVCDQPGTTRDVVTAATAIDGWPVQLRDAAGLRTGNDAIEAAGVELAKQQLAAADLVLWVLDATQMEPGESKEFSDIAARDRAELEVSLSPTQPMITVLNKIDRAPYFSQLKPGESAIAVSALVGAGLDELLAAISRRLVPAPPPAGAAVPFTTAQIAAVEAARDLAAQGRAEHAVSALRAVLS